MWFSLGSGHWELGIGHGAWGIGQFNEWILDFKFWIGFQSQIHLGKFCTDETSAPYGVLLQTFRKI
jgi:hypothetical protein